MAWKRMFQKLSLVLTVLVVFLVFAPVRTMAQGQAGIRVGVSADPGQFFFGGHVETAPLLENFSFRPNAEVGLGDGLVVIALNVEFAYRIPLENRPWMVLIGGGPALNVFSFDDNEGRGRGRDNVGGGFNILVGLEHREGLFTEFKVGMSDSPDVKFTVGYSFLSKAPVVSPSRVR